MEATMWGLLLKAQGSGFGVKGSWLRFLLAWIPKTHKPKPDQDLETILLAVLLFAPHGSICPQWLLSYGFYYTPILPRQVPCLIKVTGYFGGNLGGARGGSIRGSHHFRMHSFFRSLVLCVRCCNI